MGGLKTRTFFYRSNMIDSINKMSENKRNEKQVLSIEIVKFQL